MFHEWVSECFDLPRQTIVTSHHYDLPDSNTSIPCPESSILQYNVIISFVSAIDIGKHNNCLKSITI